MPTCVVTLALPDGTGAPRMAAFYCRALAEAGHRVVLVCGDVPASSLEAGESMLQEMRDSGVEIRSLPALRRLIRPGTVAGIREHVTQEQASCVICFQQRDQIAALWAAHQAGVPCIISAQNQYTFWGNRLAKKLKETLFAHSIRRFTSLAVCTSEIVERELLERFGLSERKTTLLPNGVDVLGFPEFTEQEMSDARASLGVDPEELLLINVGRIDVQKGQDVLIEALNTVQSDRQFKVVLVGGVSQGGNESRMQEFDQQIRKRVDECGLSKQVIFAGWRDDVPLLLRAADGYVHSARWEGWPLVLVEAMAAGLPVVSSDCAGRPLNFVDGTHGQIVPSGDVDALRRGIELLVQSDEATLTQMGSAARQLAETHYDIQVLGQQFVQLVEQAIDESHHPVTAGSPEN